MGKAALRSLLAAAATASLMFAFAAQTTNAQATKGSVPPPPKLPTTAELLTVLGTGQQLYGLNADKRLPIASATKLMTALVTLEHASLSEIVRDPNWHPAAADSQIELVPGEPMSVHDLMVAMLVPSADDAAEDLAYNVGGRSIPHFLQMMNRRARALGLPHTHYTTPIGLDTPGNYSSASDLIKLATYLLEHHPFFAHVVGLTQATLKTGYHPRHVVARNTLLGRVPWIHGVKTGHTHDAGYVLVADGRKDGMTLLSAVLGTPSEALRDSSTLALLDWGFAHFRLAKPLKAGATIARPTYNGEQSSRVDVLATKTVAWAIPKSRRLQIRLRLVHNLNGPLKRGARVGTATVLDGSATVAQVPLVLARAIPGVSWAAKVARFITKPYTLVPLIVAVLALATALTVLWRTRRGAATPA
jgi:D-alanyl-D-alanine carboxypeptidase (penicillin-binding protein 5/6)